MNEEQEAERQSVKKGVQHASRAGSGKKKKTAA
jgi:hypothetical protein